MRAPSTPAQGSPWRRRRPGALRIVKRAGSRRRVTRDHASGIETGAPRARAHRERRRDGLAAAVLQEVDVDLAAALAERTRDRGDLRELGAHHAREHLGQGARLACVEASAERDEHVEPVLTRGLHEVRRPELVEQRVDVSGHAHDVAKGAPFGSRSRISQSGRSSVGARALQTCSGIAAGVDDVEQRRADRCRRSSRCRRCAGAAPSRA